MDLQALLKSLEETGVAKGIRDSLFWFPVLEAVHVMGLALVFGSILVIDLRALGFASANRPFAKMSEDILKWTWAAFVVTAITGVLMFVTNARVYAENTFFLIKMVLLALAGANMLAFQFTAGRTAHQWGEGPTAPPIGKLAAALSLVLWISIIFMGRAIGFTTTGKAVEAAPPPASVDFDDFLGGGGDAPPAPPAPGPAPAAPAN